MFFYRGYFGWPSPDIGIGSRRLLDYGSWQLLVQAPGLLLGLLGIVGTRKRPCTCTGVIWICSNAVKGLFFIS